MNHWLIYSAFILAVLWGLRRAWTVDTVRVEAKDFRAHINRNYPLDTHQEY